MNQKFLDGVAVASVSIFLIGGLLFGLLSTDSHKMGWPTGILYLLMGFFHTIIYFLHGKATWNHMDPVDKMVCIKRFGLGPVLVFLGLYYLIMG